MLRSEANINEYFAAVGESFKMSILSVLWRTLQSNNGDNLTYAD